MFVENPYRQYMYSYPHKTAYLKTDRLELGDWQSKLNKEAASLYFHLPFCESKCGYCNLFSAPMQRPEMIDEYIKATQRHSHQLRSELDFSQVNFESLVFGGGTPLILSEIQLETLFAMAKNDFGIDLSRIHTIVETSPNQTTYSKLKLLKEQHVNRISIGVQSFVEEELMTLLRYHKASRAIKAIETIRTIGFDRLNIDLIYGIPGQNTESLKYSLDTALSFSPEEIFIYPLYQKPNTGIFNRFKIDTELQYKMYFQIRANLIDAGYTQASMRRFVLRPPEKSASCGFENMIALGCGGRSYIGDLHFCETYTSRTAKVKDCLTRYSEREDFLSDISAFQLNEEELKRRFVIKNILHCEGIQILEYKAKFGEALYVDFPEFETFFENKWVVERDGRVMLTEQGLSLSDYIGPQLASKTVLQKMERFIDA